MTSVFKLLDVFHCYSGFLAIGLVRQIRNGSEICPATLVFNNPYILLHLIGAYDSSEDHFLHSH